MVEFEAFARAASSPARPHATRSTPALDKIAVLGGGQDARLIAALCLAEGADVTLFSAYGAELEAMAASSGITLRGAGPIGTYQFNRDAVPSVKTTAQIDAAVSGADVIFLTGPIHKQRTYAMVLADHLTQGQVIVQAQARSLGALETAWMLRIGGCTADVTLVEAQNLPYWVQAEGATLHLSDAGPVPAATLPSGRDGVLAGLRRYLPNIENRASVLASGFEDGSAIIEVTALLMGGPAAPDGHPTIPMGGTPLPENANFANLIGAAQCRIIKALWAERRAVAQAFGVRNLPDSDTIITRHAGVQKGTNTRAIPDAEAARVLLRDGVIGSLVPLLSAAQLAGVDVPVTQSMITLASTVLGADVAAAGRRLDTIGVRAEDVSSARKVMETIAVGRI